MDEPILNKSRIAKNTLYLFIRMFFTMLVSLYTSRIVLKALGVEDYGIFNVVGGLVGFVSYINMGMSSASQRFITYSLGADPPEKQRLVFSNSWGLHAIISVIILILCETVGIWLFFDLLVLPEAKLSAAMVVYQCSVAITILSILTIPFGSLIMAHEKMSIYAYFTILDVISKLLICYLLVLSDGSRLSFYAFLMLATSVISLSINIIYCWRKFPESHICFKWRRPLMLKMTGFAGWSLVGTTASVCQGQGINLLLNVFGGPVLNAARGLAVQVQSAVTALVGNFQAAVTPQIIKSYASGHLDDMHSLVFNGAKYSFYLMLLISLPLMYNIDEVLGIWLIEVPPYTSIFMVLIMVNSLINALSGPLMKSADSTGNIRKYQLVVGGMNLLVLPAAYLGLKMGWPPYSVFIVQAVFAVGALYLRLWVLRDMISMPIMSFVNAVVRPILTSLLPIAIAIAIMAMYMPLTGFAKFLVSSAICVGVSLFSIWNLGLSKAERQQWKNRIKSVFNKIFHRS